MLGKYPWITFVKPFQLLPKRICLYNIANQTKHLIMIILGSTVDAFISADKLQCNSCGGKEGAIQSYNE